ncbi:MAG TPA: hypothetical protein VNF46_07555 [Gammaproteobacteria bacterium]|nr:hypothetical protein [Gammaproteobacteria bacterium]
MLKINAHFVRISEVSLADIYDVIGVYVLWSGKAKAVPSYIGEGDVLTRFSSHMKKSWAARPIDGVIAFIDAPTLHKQKAYSELVEAALLSAAEAIDRYPVHNVSDGKPAAALRKALNNQDHNVRTIRIVFSGRDPFRDPSNLPMREEKWIVIREGAEGWHIDELHWNTRSRQN